MSIGHLQHYIGKLSSDVSKTYDSSLIRASVPDEQALSCTLLEVQPGAKIKLFNTLWDEGYTGIPGRSYVEGKWLPHFNADFLDEQVEVQIHKGEGESGMVSRIEVYSIRPIL